jgi:hypothetical protein
MSGRGFLDRWADRKRAARAAEAERKPEAEAERKPDSAAAGSEAAGAEATEIGAATEPARPADEEMSAEELERLPPIEQAQTSADLRPYLQRGVPASLRRAALRRMWSLNPAIRDHVDPALDYAWDFNAGTGGQAVAAAGVARLLGSAVQRAADTAPGPARTGPPPRSAPRDGSEATAEDVQAPAPADQAQPGPAPTTRDAHEEPLQRRRRHGAAAPQPGGSDAARRG